MIELFSPLAVVAHDAGATNLIIGWLKEREDLVLHTCLQGPAISLWSSAFPGWKNDSLTDALSNAAVLLSGTGWGSDLEYEARKMARDMGVPCIGVIDHWVNYTERFVRNGKKILPDEVWVADNYAREEAEKCFHGLSIRQLPNRYLEGMVEQIGVIERPVEKRPVAHILYVLEPIRTPWGRDSRPGEFQALDFFIEHIEKLGLECEAEIRLRPHPSDPSGKYDTWCMGNDTRHKLYVDASSSLVESIAWADWVVGCETFAMVVALSANRRVVSTIPPWAPPCRLPQKQILHLRNLVSVSQ